MNTITTENKIKQGYKKTSVGIIPEDWEVKRLDQCFKHLRTYTFSRNELEYNDSEENIFNIHYGDIHSVFPNYHLNVHNDLNIIPSIINPSLNNPELLQNGDIIMADASEDYEGVGKSIELQNIQDKKLVAGTHTFALRPIFKIASYYGGYVFANWNVHKSLKRIATGISVYGLSKVNLAKIPLPIPPLPEQEAIADCLTTWDKAIEKLSALIASKKEQKKGLMQGLFSGKLKVENGELIQAKDGEDFTKEWKEVRLGDLGKTFNGLTGKTKDDFGVGLPFVSYLNVFRNNKIEENTSFDYVNIESSENQNTLNYGDLIFTTSSETPNEVGISSVVLFKPKEKLYLNSFCFGMRLNDFSILKPEYAVYLLRGQNFRREMYKLAQGSTRYNLSKASFVKIQITVPSLEEQTAIAEILQTADKEIELLEKQLTQLELQKKGLMQVLLTGTKRLV